MRNFPAALVFSAALMFGPVTAFAAPLNVLASFSIIADMAQNVGGDRIALTTLVGTDGDAHAYEPRPADAVAAARADVILVNGLGFEGFLGRLVEASATKASIVTLSKGVKQRGAASEDMRSELGDFDPHAFQSVPNAEIYVRNIVEAFCAADATGCPEYQANAAAYLEKLVALDADMRARIAAIPEDRRVIITSHDAFFYFGQEYGFTFLAPAGISTESEPSAANMATLITEVRQDKAAALFFENITDPRLVEEVGRETGVQVGGELYSDALSPANGPAVTYIDMIRHNVETISAAILGK